MLSNFKNAAIAHTSQQTVDDGAVQSVLSPENFATARAEITTWDGYAPTPLVKLPALAGEIGVGEILYKDESPRFGLGSFKALGGAYAGLRVLARQLDASMQDIRDGKYAAEVAKITLCSATDGNHGKSLAWGANRFGCPGKIFIHAGAKR